MPQSSKQTRLAHVDAELAEIDQSVGTVAANANINVRQINVMPSAAVANQFTPNQLKLLARAITLNREKQALQIPAPEPVTVIQRGPSLDELNAASGLSNFRSLLYQVQQPPSPIIRP
jgi:hypothetical protein